MVKPARRDERARSFASVVLCFPHLMLPDVGHHDGPPAGDAREIADHVCRVEPPEVGQRLDVAGGYVGLELVLDAPAPRLGARLRGWVNHSPRTSAASPEIARSTATFLLISRRVYLDTDLLLGPRVKPGHLSGEVIVEAHPQGDEQIGFLDRMVDRSLTVHPRHAQVTVVSA